jgi:hypothetical protein
MVTLVCALVGVKGNAFAVDIDASKLVDHLKDAIKVKKENDLKAIDADKLHLFLAKKGDNTWLESSTDDVKKLKKGEKTALIEALTHEDNELQGESGLQKVLKDMPQPATDQIHVLVVVPQQEPSQPRLWLVNGSVENAVNTKGVRCRLYRLAGSYLGYYDPDHRIGDQIQAMWYDGTTLRVHVLFKEGMYLIALESCCLFNVLLLYEEREALLFENALQDERMTLTSPLNGQVIMTEVSTVSGEATGLRRIFTRHYDPQETESPQDTMSSLSTNTSIVDVMTDEFKYQRIESETWFGPLGKAQSCHLMSREHCRRYSRKVWGATSKPTCFNTEEESLWFKANPEECGTKSWINS